MNLFETGSALSAAEEIYEDIAQIAGVRIERIVSTGQSSPEGFWYDQDHDEWVTVLQGEGVVGFEDSPDVHLNPGDTLMLPAHRRHRVVATSSAPPCIWLAVHGPGGK